MMAGNVRFDSSSATPEEYPFGNYQNGQRGNYPGSSLDRSGSFRESVESCMFNSITNMSRGNATSMADVPPLMLDPITMGDQKYIRSGELRKVLGISFGSTAEDNSSRASHMKPPPPVDTEELKRVKESILDACRKASGRVKRLDESLYKLNQYCEALSLKKQQRNEMLATARSGGSNLLKMGSLMHRNPTDLVSQRLEERTKNVVLNKRVRSSVAELRAEGRSNNPARQNLVMGRDRDMPKDGGEGSDLVEDKIRRLPAGGEGWEKRMKRKRTVGNVFTRPMDGDGELKRVMHPKLNNETSLQSSDAQGFRSGLSNGPNGMNKFDNASLAASPNVRGIPKNDIEKLSLSRDSMVGSTKERTLAKGNTRLNMREDNHTVSPSTVTKGKASRAPRTGPLTSTNSSPNFPCPSGTLDGWEQSPGINKVHPISGVNNRKRSLPSGSSSSPMAQWVGQRPQKISRTRRTNLVSPVSNLDEMQVSGELCPPELGPKMTSIGTNGPLLSKGGINGIQKRVKQENISSPARFSESEESTGGENRESRLKDKGLGNNEMEERTVNAPQNVGSPLLFRKKNKILNREEIGDGVRRQGRTGRGPPASRVSVSPMREKLDTPASTKPLKNSRPTSDKSGSKSGRPPLKKLLDRKVTRVGLTPTGSPDGTGESDDDREELLAVANFASDVSSLRCSNSFWKKVELTFASVRIEDISCLKQQLKSTEKHHESLSQGDLVHEQNSVSQIPDFGERQRSMQSGIWSNESRTADKVDQVQDDGNLSGRSNVGRGSKIPPLYEIVLSALIVEDETEEFEENGGQGNIFFQYGSDNMPGGTCSPVDSRTTKRPRLEVEYESLCLQDNGQSNVDRISCNGNTNFNRSTGFHAKAHNDDVLLDGCRFLDSETGMFSKFPKSSSDGSLSVHITSGGISSPDCQYEQMCVDEKVMMELQSLGVYIDAVPALADGEDETINQDIGKLQKELCQQVDKKKAHLKKIIKAMEEAKELEGWNLERVAMDRLVELAYRKRLATRGSSASKSGIPKVSKHVALVFMKRTLARCHKFEETGKSCFTEPALRDALLASPPWQNDALGLPENQNYHMEPGMQGPLTSRADRPHNDKMDEVPLDTFGSTFTTSLDQDFAKTGPILNRGKKKEVLLDDVGSASLRTASVLGNTLLGGAKGKRSERDKDIKSSVGKAGRASIGNTKGDRKTKSKPKQKTAQLSTSGNGFINKFAETTHPVYPSGSGNKKREVGSMPHDNIPKDESRAKENLDLQLPGFSMEELWSNIEVDNLQDNELEGLGTPMDDLSDLNMFS
ncbi:hypothetical protein SLEP1_g5403 [Rubroshorea leprosula]|uniref:Uncharacterized protein n=1 Tax=Rubroshorea leprosula TaxID=152421 RepID=A0AAV5HW55_9ROSI|nr:hypothetical protein SLEP1_g5403 [Rubroshorea leprosula]